MPSSPAFLRRQSSIREWTGRALPRSARGAGVEAQELAVAFEASLGPDEVLDEGHEVEVLDGAQHVLELPDLARRDHSLREAGDEGAVAAEVEGRLRSLYDPAYLLPGELGVKG